MFYVVFPVAYYRSVEFLCCTLCYSHQFVVCGFKCPCWFSSCVMFCFHVSLLILRLLFFFFFKQKTAYEVRISDWSSDVCSSDLGSSPTLSAAISAMRSRPPASSGCCSAPQSMSSLPDARR